MATDTSATGREEAPHVLQTSRTNTIMNALKQRAQAVLNDQTIDAESRAVIRYGLETNDPWLAELVKRTDRGESMVDSDFAHETMEANSRCKKDIDGSNKEKVEALAEIICGAGEECAAALLVLMGTLANSTEPGALANAVKHFAFTRCGELNPVRNR